MSHRFQTSLQYVLPKHALSSLAGAVASTSAGDLTAHIIRWFVDTYQVDMSEAENPDIASYTTFNLFFSRALKSGARPLASADLVSPVDGCISQLGPISGGEIFQAKGHSYSTTALLGGDAGLADEFANGHFATLYLSPKDYHRVHMPCAGTLRRMIYVPGDLFSVNPVTARSVPGLFARNERVVCIFDSKKGPFAMVLVGATIVGSMATSWHGLVKPTRQKLHWPGRAAVPLQEWHYAPKQVVLKQGEEMGRFLLGSTVVVLFPSGSLSFKEAWEAEKTIRMGQAMATRSAK